MFGLALADLRRHWLISLAIALVLALACGLTVAISLEERAIRLGSARASSAFDVVLGAPGSDTQLVLSALFLQPAPLPLMPGTVYADIKRDPRVAMAAPVAFGDTVLGTPIIGTTVELFGAGGMAGIADGQTFTRLGDAVAGASAPFAIGDRLTPSHGLAGEVGEVHQGAKFVVVGRLASTGTPWDKALFVPVEAVWHVHGLGEGAAEHGHDTDAHGHDAHGFDPSAPITPDLVSRPDLPGLPAILVKPRLLADAYRLRADYRSGKPAIAVFPGEVLTRLYGLLGDIRSILAMVSMATLGLVAGLVVLIAQIHVVQRRRQIAALRAFGAPRRAIFVTAWLQFFIVCALGIGIGHALGYAAAVAMSHAVERSGGFAAPVAFTAGDIAIAALLLAGAGIAAAIPAVMACRQPVTEALRA